jgi:hypothetical protein
MMEDNAPVIVRPVRGVRLVEHPHGISVFPEPHDVPVLPAGWAPLDRADQEAVLGACDSHHHACRLRLGSPWDPDLEYRVYALNVDAWHGVCAATMFSTAPADTRCGDLRMGNTRLLAIARDVRGAARIAVDFLNWDLEAEGARWRLDLISSDPRPS